MVKLKLISDKVRKVFLRTEKERAAFINAIIRAQGYNTQLDQYTIKGVMKRTMESKVMYAKHNTLDYKVVIKSIPAKYYRVKAEYYRVKAARFAISEVEA